MAAEARRTFAPRAIAARNAVIGRSGKSRHLEIEMRRDDLSADEADDGG
jgi:hypothetical protein